MPQLCPKVDLQGWEVDASATSESRLQDLKLFVCGAQSVLGLFKNMECKIQKFYRFSL